MNKIKYALCIFITAAVTCAVIFLPYLYYSRTDKRDADNYVTETYSLETKSDKITSDELIKLLSSDEAIWLRSDTYSMYYYDDKLFDELNAAQPQLKNAFNDNEFAEIAIEEFYKFASQNPAYTVEEVTVNGDINGSPVSVTLLYIEYSNNTESIRKDFSILMDKKTKMVYEFKCLPGKALMPDVFATQHDFDESAEQGLFEETYFDLQTYWNLNGQNKCNVIVFFDYFYFSIMPLSFSEYKFNNFNSIMYGYDEPGNGYEISEKNKY